MTFNGLLTEVRWEWGGTTLTADAAAGASTLSVDDVTTLSLDQSVWVGDEGPFVIEATVEGPPDSLTLDGVLAAAWEEGTPVIPDVGGQPMKAWVAEVVLTDSETPIEVPLVVHDLAVMKEGVYDPPVGVIISDDQETIVDLPGTAPIISGDYIPPDSLPDLGGPDGFPPAFSPQPEVIAGIGAFYLRWAPPANADALRFEVHVSPNSGFSPTTATQYSETASYSMTVRHLPDVDSQTGVPLPFDYDVPYYFRLVAKDADGAAPAGTQTQGVLTQITGPDIGAEEIRGEHIIGGTITGDKFSGQVILGSTISTGAIDQVEGSPTFGKIVGSRIDLGPDGLKTYDSSGQEVVSLPLSSLDAAKVRAHMEILSAEVADNFVMHGTYNKIAQGAQLGLAAGVEPPQSQVNVSMAYDTVALDTKTKAAGLSSIGGPTLGTFAFDASAATSMCWSKTDNCWLVVHQRTNGFRVWKFNADGSLKLSGGVPDTVDWPDRDHATIAWGDGASGTATNGWALLFRQGGGGYFFWGPTFINFVPASWILDIDSRYPTIGYDSVNNQWGMAQSNGGGNGTFHVRRFQPNAGSGGGWGTLTSIAVREGVAGSGTSRRTNFWRMVNIASIGGTRHVHSTDDYVTVKVFNSSNPPVQMSTAGSNNQWAAPVSMVAMDYNGTNFWALSTTGVLYKYTDWTWTDDTSAILWSGLAAFDSRTAGVSTGTSAPWPGQTAGQHETAVGSLTSFTIRKRGKVVFTLPQTPDAGGDDDVDTWKVYAVRQVARPTGAQLKWAAQGGAAGALTPVTITADPSGVAPPAGLAGTVGAGNNFPGGTPAKIIDGKGNLIVDANGYGVWAPPGTISMFGGTAAPSGWLLCDGSEVSRTTYASLFATIGTQFGPGDGSTTFHLPDMRSRYPMGVADSAGGRPVGAFETTSTAGSAPGAGDFARIDHRHTHNVNYSTQTNTSTGGSTTRVNNITGTDSQGVAGGNVGYHATLFVNFIIKA